MIVTKEYKKSLILEYTPWPSEDKTEIIKSSTFCPKKINAVLRSILFIILQLLFIVESRIAYCAPITLGWQELVRVLPGEPVIEASLDTIDGAGSLHVESYRRIAPTKTPDKGKQPLTVTPTSHPTNSLTAPSPTPPYDSPPVQEKLNRRVRFNLTDRFGHTHNYELPVLRSVKVKSSSGKTEIRPVVPLTVCIGSLKIDGEFSLRRDLQETNHIRIGRRDLAGKALVDPSKSFTLQPSCR